MAPIFTDFRRIRKRMRRTLNYGESTANKLNLPLSEMVVDYFNRTSPFDYLQPETSAKISTRGYVDPCTLVVALVYLDRLRDKNKSYFESSDPTDLYLPALILASKFLHDTDTIDRATNSDWAKAAEFNEDRLNSLEWEFVGKLDWNLLVKPNEFEEYLKRMERWVAEDTVSRTGQFTYNELLQLTSSMPSESSTSSFIQELLAMFGLLSLVYSFSFLSLLSTCQTIENYRHEATPTSSFTLPINIKNTVIEENDDVCETMAEHYLSTFNFEPCPVEAQPSENGLRSSTHLTMTPSYFGLTPPTQLLDPIDPYSGILASFKNLTVFPVLGTVF